MIQNQGQLSVLVKGLRQGAPNARQLAESLVKNPADLPGLERLFLSYYYNLQGDIESAATCIREAFRTDPHLLQKLLPSDNPNYGEKALDHYAMEPVTQCPICGHPDRKPLFAGYAVGHPLYHIGLNPCLVWVQCKACTHVYTRERNPFEAFSKGPERFSPHVLIHDTARYAADKESVEHLALAKPKGEALELGPGGGTRLLALRDLGMAVRGIELRSRIVEHCRALGLPVSQEDFFQHQKEKGQYDVLILGDVIEHMADPHAVMQKCSDLLSSNGLLWISTPIFDGPVLAQKRETDVDPYFFQVEHTHYFTLHSLLILASRHGFQLLSQKPGKTYIGSVGFTFERAHASGHP